MNRKQQQANLIFKLGQLLGPPIKMAENHSAYDADERTRIMARLSAEIPPFTNEVREFCVSEPGHDYVTQYWKANAAIENLRTHFMGHSATEEKLFELIKETAPKVQGIILSIPVPTDSLILEARTPFSTYCLVNSLCSTVTQKIVWQDRYFDQTIFHRYFIDTPTTAQITLLTWPRSECKGKRDESRYDEFIDLSKLFARERGPQGYRLIRNPNFHDRWLRCDDKLFALGGSIKDIGNGTTFSISRLDSTMQNFKEFDDPVATGTEVFGPNQTSHL